MTGCQPTQSPCGPPDNSHGGAPPHTPAQPYPPPPKAQSPSPLPCGCHPAQPVHVCPQPTKHQLPSHPPPPKPQSHNPPTPLPCGCPPAQKHGHHVCPSSQKHQPPSQPPPSKPQSHNPPTRLPCGCPSAQKPEHHVCPSPPKHQPPSQPPPPPKPQSHNPPTPLPCGCPPAQKPEHHVCPPPSESQSYSATIITSSSSSSSAQYSVYQTHASATNPNPFTAVVPSPHVFTVDMESEAIACFQSADRRGTGTVDDKQLQKSLSSFHHSFNRHTIRLLIFIHTNSHDDKIGQTEFVQMYSSVMKWKATFEIYDRDRSGKIDTSELGEALASLGYVVTPQVLKKLVSKYGKGESNKKAIAYNYFIECCVTVKGLSDRFMESDTTLSGYASFGYECFMCSIVPFMAS